MYYPLRADRRRNKSRLPAYKNELPRVLQSINDLKKRIADSYDILGEEPPEESESTLTPGEDQRDNSPPPEPVQPALHWRINPPYYNLEGGNTPDWCARLVMVDKPGDYRLKIFGLIEQNNDLVLGPVSIALGRQQQRTNHVQVKLTEAEVEILKQ